MAGNLQEGDAAGSGCLWKVLGVLLFLGVAGGFFWVLVKLVNVEV